MTRRGSLTFGAGAAVALLCGWVGLPMVLYRHSDQPLQFSHKVHTGEKGGMKCEDCHAIGSDGRFAGIPPLETCAPCHAEPQGKTAEEKRFVKDYVAANREVPWRVYAEQPSNVWFPHAVHVKVAKIECQRCHGPHGASDRLRAFEQNRISTYSRDIEGYELARLRTDSWQRGMKMDDCMACHRQRGVRDSCLTCHK